jgi:hypothetical protein
VGGDIRNRGCLLVEWVSVWWCVYCSVILFDTHIVMFIIVLVILKIQLLNNTNEIIYMYILFLFSPSPHPHFVMNTHSNQINPQ